MSLINDVKALPEQHRAIERRARWYAAGALCGLVLAYGIVGARDYADAVRVDILQAEHLRQKKAAFEAGFDEGARRAKCIGLRIDAATGEPIK